MAGEPPHGPGHFTDFVTPASRTRLPDAIGFITAFLARKGDGRMLERTAGHRPERSGAELEGMSHRHGAVSGVGYWALAAPL